ncbi:hypothetical protein ACFX11_016456 [Malus domestica]
MSRTSKPFEMVHTDVWGPATESMEDNGTEFLSNNMLQYISSQGIIHQTSCVGTPQQNGVAERKNRDLLEKTHALMIHMHVPKKF